MFYAAIYCCRKSWGGDYDAMILAAVPATFWPIRVFGVCSLCLYVLTRFTCGNRGEVPCVLVLTCAVAVPTKWLISHHCWLRSENLFLAIKIHVVFWMDWILCLGRCSSRGAVNRSKLLVSILEQQYFWWRFYPAFSNTLGFYSVCLPFRFSDSS